MQSLVLQYWSEIGSLILVFIGIKWLLSLTKKEHSTLRMKPGTLILKKDETQVAATLFTNKQGLVIRTYRRPVTSPRGIIFFCHGFGEYALRNEHVYKQLNDHGYSVYTCDNQGHGLSGGDKGYVESFDDYIDDYRMFIRQQLDILDVPKNIPRFLFGCSMGGNMAVQVAQKEKGLFTGVVLCAPMMAVDPVTAPPLIVAVVQTLAGLVPKAKSIKLQPELIVNDKKVVELYSFGDSGINHDELLFKTAFENLGAMKIVSEITPTISFPVLIIQGADDLIVQPKGSKEFIHSISSKDKTYIEYPGIKHEIFNESFSLTGGKPMKDCVEWLNEKVAFANNMQ